MEQLITTEVQKSEDGTRKFLFKLEDGNVIETVFMQLPYGGSVCVSSQAGCSMGCAFCASGLLKKVRDLSSEEILGQVLSVRKYLNKEEPEAAAITHAVVMGTGEPFDNYSNVLEFCDRISDPRLPEAIAPRHITVSTCGFVPKILKFAETENRYNLAISLHAANDQLRSRLMPINRKYPLSELLGAAEEYCRKTKRRITFEYILLKGINDSMEDAEELSVLLRPSELFYVNLIPYNPVGEFGFQGSEKGTALAFYDVLMRNGVKATLRKERGADISAACGQLRLKAGK